MTNIVASPRHASNDLPPRLEPGERLFLWGFRAMAQHHRCGRPSIAAMRHLYGQFHVEDAVASLDAMVHAFACTAHTAIAIHSPVCPCVSECETVLLRAMAAAQSTDLLTACREFERWLPELAADWVLNPACGIGRMFQAEGMVFPLREVRTKRLNNATETRKWPIISNTLH